MSDWVADGRDGAGGVVAGGNGAAKSAAVPGVEPGREGSGLSPEVRRRRRELLMAEVEAVLAERRDELLRFPNVIDVRAGFKVSGGWLTETPAIVVVVRQKSNDALPIPKLLDGVWVDVAPATPAQQLAAQPIAEQRRYHPAAQADDLEIVRVSRYVAPPHLKLEPVRGRCWIQVHVSPDAGWPNLREFISRTTHRLTVGMYDFTAPHIIEFLSQTLSQVSGGMRLILDPGIALGSPGGENPKANDIEEVKLREQLEQQLGQRLEFLWAAVKRTGKTLKGIFPTAYHIKLAVRDGRYFWLSSGNWQSSNQPDIDPIAEGELSVAPLKKFNREWHLVVGHSGLASLFEQYLEWDMEQAEPLQAAPETMRLPELWTKPLEEAAEVATRWFAPKMFRFTDAEPIEIVPLLSPDNYAAELLELINSARHTLYIQNQYIKIAKENADEFMAVIDAIRARAEAGVDVRIIVRDLPPTREQLEELVNHGYQPEWLKVLDNTHTKGVIVDSQVVMVGSHNLSNDGVLYNRDASLILKDAGVAAWFQQVFLYDWERARRFLHNEVAMPIVASDGEAQLVGWVKQPWRAVCG